MIRILHIEDDAVDRMAFKRQLAAHNDCSYEAAPSLKDARIALAANTYDVVVTDYMLGDGTSIEIMPEIAKYPVVFTTATGAEEVAVTAMKMGAMDYLVKDPDRHYIKIIYAVIQKALTEFGLRRRVRTLSVAMESIGECVCITDRTETIIYVNPAFCQQYRIEEEKVMGHKLNDLDFFPETDGGEAEYKKPFCTAARDHHKRSNGETFPAWVRHSALLGENDQPEGSILIITDITELAQKEESLVAAQKEATAANNAKSEFLAVMSHEIRTPLNAILGYSDLLLENQVEADRTTYLQRIVSAGQHLLTVVNEILDLAKIETGSVELHETKFSFTRIIQDVFDVLSIRALQKQLKFHFSIPAVIVPAALGDEALLKKVVYNLISNAIKFTDKGSVEVSIEYQEARAGIGKFTLAVADSGIGIADENREKVFAPFAQADSGIARQYGGTGLGLSICRKIIQLMGGDIELVSKVGKGSTFSFSVELPHSAAPAEAPVAHSSAPDTGPPTKILFVDDSEDNQILTEVYLRHSGYQVDYVTSGAAALENVAQKSYDLILMDVQMPEMDGYTATRKIRALCDQQATPQPIILACTANAQAADFEASHDAGCNGHLTKPIRKNELLSEMQRMLAGRKSG